MINKQAKFAVGEFVDVNHAGNSMQITRCTIDYSKNEYLYFVRRVSDDAGFESYEKSLIQVDKDTLIQALVARLSSKEGNVRG